MTLPVVVGIDVAKATLDQHLAHEALAMAVVAREPPRGLLFHSDRRGAFL
jgi:hypothetical protein